MANKYFRELVTFGAVLVSGISFAQGPPPPPPPLPIDGGLAALFVLGAGYAIKKIYDRSRE